MLQSEVGTPTHDGRSLNSFKLCLNCEFGLPGPVTFLSKKKTAKTSETGVSAGAGRALLRPNQSTMAN